LADFCKALDVDYENVRRLISHDRRINGAWMDVLHDSYRGFGGFCFPKDLNALIAHGEELLESFGKNDRKEKEVFSKALNVFKSVRDYNEALLKSQGLTPEIVSVHNAEIKKKLGCIVKR
jgi:UDP-glucose 6-dehydrogenase